MRVITALFLALALTSVFPTLHAQTAETLQIYLVDVEGGNATLYISPSGESLLIDTGNGGANAVRDAERIAAAAEDAGLSQIDHLITTHWHGDHFGGMVELANRIPIRNFIDHGPSVQRNENTDAFLATTYPELYADGMHTVVQPGDVIPFSDLDFRVVTSANQVLSTPLPGAGNPNPYCADFTPQAEDTGENAQSVGSHVTFGQFRTAHLGDITANTEFDLMCPNNPLGTVDLFFVGHHGQPSSNIQALVHAIRPRVALINNGTRKGGQPEAMQMLHSSPGLEDIWQLHFSLLSGQEYTVPGVFIANTIDDEQYGAYSPSTVPVSPMPQPRGVPGGAPAPPRHNGTAYWIKVSAQQDGTFTVTNTRNGFSKTYEARSEAATN